VVRDGDPFGTAVQLAARVGDAAGTGQVFVTNVVRELCAGKQFIFRELGPTTLKGFDDSVDLFEAQSRGVWEPRGEGTTWGFAIRPEFSSSLVRGPAAESVRRARLPIR
jgi:hypothetical protein